MAVPIGILFLWLGYSLGYYGYNRITSGNDKFVDLIYPGRWKPGAGRDSGGSGNLTAAQMQQLSTQYNATHPQGQQPAPPPPTPTGTGGVPTLPGSLIPGIFPSVPANPQVNIGGNIGVNG